MKKSLSLIVFCFVALFTNAQWVATNMPSGALAFSLAIKNEILILGTVGNGIFVSSDRGASWSEKNNGIVNKQIWSLAVIDDYLFASTGNGGVYRSVDNGNTWVPANGNIPSTTIIRNFAKFDNKIFATSTNKGVYVSTDGGLNWTQNNTGIVGLVGLPLLVTDTDLFAGVLQGVYKYNKASSDWTKVSTGVPNLTIAAFTWFKDGQGNKKIFAGLSGSTNMVVRTTNNALGWELAETGLAKVPVATLASKETVIFAGNDFGVYYSTNAGDTWNDASTGFPTSSYATFLTTGSDFLYVLHTGKVWKRKYSDFGITTSVAKNSFESGFELKQNFPNPFRNQTTIEFKLPNTSDVSLKIFDLSGREVYQVVNETLTRGVYRHEVNVTKVNLQPGTYVYQLQTSSQKLSGKMVVE
jgi:photosystem II stability/assembly factor-like uncharacterized protein